MAKYSAPGSSARSCGLSKPFPLSGRNNSGGRLPVCVNSYIFMQARGTAARSASPERTKRGIFAKKRKNAPANSTHRRCSHRTEHPARIYSKYPGLASSSVPSSQTADQEHLVCHSDPSASVTPAMSRGEGLCLPYSSGGCSGFEPDSLSGSLEHCKYLLPFSHGYYNISLYLY